VTSPHGQDVDDAAAAIVDEIVDEVFDLDPVDRYDRLVWHRQVLLVAAQRLTAESGFPLAALNQAGLSHRRISAELAKEEITLSPAAVGDLIGKARAAQQG
jgi:hypothetical protein